MDSKMQAEATARDCDFWMGRWNVHNRRLRNRVEDAFPPAHDFAGSGWSLDRGPDRRLELVPFVPARERHENLHFAARTDFTHPTGFVRIKGEFTGLIRARPDSAPEGAPDLKLTVRRRATDQPVEAVRPERSGCARPWRAHDGG
jgi:hypothetical protein